MNQTVPKIFQDIVDQLYNELNMFGLNWRFSPPRSIGALTSVIHMQETTQQRVDLCWYVWQQMCPNVPAMRPKGDLDLHSTTSVIRDILRPYADDVLNECGIEQFDRLRSFWDIEGFQAAIAHEHWSGALYILERTMTPGKASLISEQRDRLWRPVLYQALNQLGCPSLGSLDEQKTMIIQELNNRITKIVLTEAVGECTSVTPKRKM